MEDAISVPIEEAGASMSSLQAPPPPTPMCQVCLLAPSKYKCPGCQMRTCSLTCVNVHKEPREGRDGCTGKRDRLKFVSLTDFDDRQLLSDYNLLEEVKRVDDVARRCLPPFPRHQLPPALQTLVYQANKRRVDLRLMAPGMSRRVNNTTRFNGQEQKLSWRVEWNFYSGPDVTQAASRPSSSAAGEEPQKGVAVETGGLSGPTGVAPMNKEEVDLGDLDGVEDGKDGEGGPVSGSKGSEAVGTEGVASPPLKSQLPPPIVLVDEKVPEDQTLLKTLQDHLSQFKPNSGSGARQFALREFRRDASALRVFMQKEEQPANSPCFYSMDLNRSLGSQLAGKVIIEYPVLCVCLPSLTEYFPAGDRLALGPGGLGGGRGRGRGRGRGEGMRGGRGRGGGYRGRGRFDGRGRGFRGGGRGFPARGRGEKRPREG